ncbi:MAG: HAD-IA family hydrolase [Rhodococcus sp.]|nr:HAD-IA family hydrolase [Rhodococcus sp. (in: high G+C Gram-positive bacteria)]
MVTYLFLDFDGVIHRTATRQLRSAFSTVVNERVPLPTETVDTLFTSLQAMPSAPALGSLFEWIGIADVPDAIKRVHDCSPHGWAELPDRERIDTALVSLVRNARRNGAEVKVLSSAAATSARAEAALTALVEFDVEWMPGYGSKADPDTYRRAAAATNSDAPERCVLIDDSVIAVSAARASGMSAYLSSADRPFGLVDDTNRNWQLEEIELELFGKG